MFQNRIVYKTSSNFKDIEDIYDEQKFLFYYCLIKIFCNKIYTKIYYRKNNYNNKSNNLLCM